MLQFLMRSLKIFDRLDSKGVKQSIFVLSVVWVAILLGVWEFAIVLKIDSNYILPLFFDIDALNNVAVWQYFSNKIIAGDIFLTQNEINFTAQSAVLPWLSLILSALITEFFGQFIGLVIFSLLFPLLCYIYLVRIYKLFLPLRWSIMLAALGLFSMVNYPFRDFLFNIFSGDIASSLPKMTQPDIMGQPFPSLSLLIFLLLFYYSIMSTKIGASKQILMSALWGIQGYVHILNLAFGLPFWMIAMGIFYWRTSRNLQNNDANISLIKKFILNSGIMLILSSPVIFGTFIVELNLLTGHDVSLDWFVILTYIVTPLVLLAICFFTFRIDPYELVVKFHIVWIAIIVELLLLIFWYVFGFGLPGELIDARLGVFFLHLFYYVPTIYYAHKSYGKYYHGSEANIISVYLRRFFSFAFRQLSLIYLNIFCLLLTVFILLGADSVHHNFNSQIKDDYEEVHYALTGNMQASKLHKSSAESLFRMINNITTSTMYSSSWPNVFVEPIAMNDAIRKFAQHAHLHSWSLSQFKLFMLPNSYIETNLLNDIYANTIVPGLGYWLLTNSFSLDGSKFEDFHSLIERHYIEFEKINTGEKTH
jgi:hypothetical protein